MTPTNMDADMSDAAKNDRQRRAKDGNAGAVPEGEGRRGTERQRDLRSLKSPREGDDLQGESSRVGRAHRPTTPSLEWEYNSGVVIHQSGCNICRQYGIHYFPPWSTVTCRSIKHERSTSPRAPGHSYPLKKQ